MQHRPIHWPLCVLYCIPPQYKIGQYIGLGAAQWHIKTQYYMYEV